MKKINIVVGAGFSGATIANLIATNLKEEVIIIDKKEHLAGNSFDYIDENGITIHKYGSHIFHTNNEKVWKFINKFTSFNNYKHEVVGMIDGEELHIPFNFNTLNQIVLPHLAKKYKETLLKYFKYGDKITIADLIKTNNSDLAFISNYVNNKIIRNYTKKQWGCNPDELDKSVTKRVPIYLSEDNKYFQDKYQGIPLEGYTQIIQNMLNHKNIKVILNKDFKTFYKENEELVKNATIFYTGSIDEFFEYKYGMLPYRSVYFEFETHNKEYYQSHACINYPNDNEYTRIHEYKHYLNNKSQKTVIAKEYSEAFEENKNERQYPIIKKENIDLYNKYKEDANQLNNVYFLGRLGDYKYYNMDCSIKRAIEIFEIHRKKTKNNMPKVSIIIPIYNVENYLKECLDSVVNQTLKDIEIICVNDGSTDNCLNILKEYANNDSRIKIIDKKNSGYGHSMNVGLDNATGEYIGIVEPDDYVETNMYEELYEIAIEKDVDIVKADFRIFLGKNDKRFFSYMPLDRTSNFYNKITNPKEEKDVFNLKMNTWTGIYKKEFIEKYNIRHNETAGASYQDNGFWFQTLSQAEKIYCLNKNFYNKRFDNPNSSVNNKAKVFCMKEEYDFIQNFLDKNEDIKKLFLEIYWYKKFQNYLFTYKRIADEYKEEFALVFHNEFKEAMENKLINMKLFKPKEKALLKTIIYNKKDFYKKCCIGGSFINKIFNIRNHYSLEGKEKIITLLGNEIRIKVKSKK